MSKVFFWSDLFQARKTLESLTDQEVLKIIGNNDEDMSVVVHLMFQDQSLRLWSVISQYRQDCGSSDFDMVAGELNMNLRFFHSSQNDFLTSIQGQLQSDWMINVIETQTIGKQFPQDNFYWLSYHLDKCKNICTCKASKH